MKWIVMMLAVALLSSAMIGCEARVETTPTAPGSSTPTTGEIDMGDPAMPTTGPATQASASLTVSNQYCAVMAENKADPKVTVVHAGKTIGFCCEDCIPTFTKEPAKYLASLK
ncbi:MAG: hypothetical protein M3478_09985 [Planctomycetota bacterium]|nr:hypothetical protein [Planctomycetota bacterium]